MFFCYFFKIPRYENAMLSGGNMKADGVDDAMPEGNRSDVKMPQMEDVFDNVYFGFGEIVFLKQAVNQILSEARGEDERFDFFKQV